MCSDVSPHLAQLTHITHPVAREGAECKVVTRAEPGRRIGPRRAGEARREGPTKQVMPQLVRGECALLTVERTHVGRAADETHDGLGRQQVTQAEEELARQREGYGVPLRRGGRRGHQQRRLDAPPRGGGPSLESRREVVDHSSRHGLDAVHARLDPLSLSLSLSLASTPVLAGCGSRTESGESAERRGRERRSRSSSLTSAVSCLGRDCYETLGGHGQGSFGVSPLVPVPTVVKARAEG